MTSPDPSDKIYLTAKTRMTSESRIRAQGKLLHILISWYSFCLIALSVAQATSYFIFPAATPINICLSVGLFGISLFTYGERYFERADQYRNCYLKLQELNYSIEPADEKNSKYLAILNQYENQRDTDYDEMLFDSWIRNQSLKNSQGPVSIGILSGAMVSIKRILRFSFWLLLFLLPGILVLSAGNLQTNLAPAEIPVNAG